LQDEKVSKNIFILFFNSYSRNHRYIFKRNTSLADMEEHGTCPKCQGTLRIRKADGTIQPCFDCLQAGRMDVHSKKLPDHDIRL